MGFPFKRILCSIDFDDSAPEVLRLGAQIAAASDGVVYVLHVTPMMLAPAGWGGAPIYGVDVFKTQEETARTRLHELASRQLAGVKYELITKAGESVETIVNAEKQIPADLVVMATHGRRGLAHAFLGSVAEGVVRRSYCPVLTVRTSLSDAHMVGHWMTTHPIAVAPGEKLTVVQSRMREGRFRSMPVVDQSRLVGIITDRDIRQHSEDLDNILVESAMTRETLTVTPRQSIWDAARLLAERKIGGMPVLDEQASVVGIITTTDLLRAFAEMQNK